MFLKIALDNITITSDLKKCPDGSTLLINIEAAHLNPLIGKTTEMIAPIMKGVESKFQITLQNGKPYVLIERVKLTFLNRVITELELLQKELKLKIKKVNETISERKVNHLSI